MKCPSILIQKDLEHHEGPKSDKLLGRFGRFGWKAGSRNAMMGGSIIYGVSGVGGMYVLFFR